MEAMKYVVGYVKSRFRSRVLFEKYKRNVDGRSLKVEEKAGS